MKPAFTGATTSDTQNKMFEMLSGSPVVPLIGIDEPDRFEEVIRSAIQIHQRLGKTATIEVLLRDQDAVDSGLAKLKELKEKYGDQINILAGSIIQPEDVEKAAEAGLDGLVSGGFSEKIASMALQTGLPYLPPAATLEEVKKLNELGFKVIKLFPARSPSFGAVKAPLARTGMEFTEAKDHNINGAYRTATQALKAWENGVTQAVINPADTEGEWSDIMNYMKENAIVACCTGGVKLENLQEFSRERQVIGVGASYIVSDAKKAGALFAKTYEDLLSGDSAFWKESKAGGQAPFVALA